MATVEDQFYDWNGGAPLLPEQHASSMRWLKARFLALFESGGFDRFVSSVQSADKRTLTLTTASGFTATADLPPGPIQPAGERVVGRRYAVDDLVTWQGSSYVVLVPHVASVVLADDLAALRLQLVAAKGKDAETFRGAYQPGQAYAAGDVVYTGTPGVTEVVYSRAFMDVPVDGAAPGSFPWTQVSVSPYVELRYDADGKPAAGATLRRYTAPRFTFLRAGFPASVASLDVAAAAASTYLLKVDGNQVGSFTFAAGSKTAVFTLAQATFMAPGQRLTVHAPATQDAAASGLDFTLTLGR